MLRRFSEKVSPPEQLRHKMSEEEEIAQAKKNIRDLKIFDYQGLKYSYEKEDNYGKWAREELFGMTYEMADTKFIRAEKKKDNLVVAFLTLCIIYVFYINKFSQEEVLQAFSEKVNRENRDPHLETSAR